MWSGYYGFGMLDLTLDWNYASFLLPLYTRLWANAHQIAGAVVCCWMICPTLYFTNTLDSQNYPPMSSDTFDLTGQSYNITRILTPEYTLNQTAMDAYSPPRWSLSYTLYFFWGFASTTAALTYAVCWYGKDAWDSFQDGLKNVRNDYDDPYVPHWWYLALLVPCLALSLGCIYGRQILEQNLKLTSDYKFGFYMKIAEKEMVLRAALPSAKGVARQWS